MVRAGNLLEITVKKIFDLAGFKTKQDVKIKGYEIDVLAKYEGYTIAVECKERSSGGLIVRNIIHEWSGKNKIINADRVVLAVYGAVIKTSDIKLARGNGIIIWSERDIEKFLDLAYEKKKEALNDILDSLNITTKEVIKLREERERNWKPNLQLIRRVIKLMCPFYSPKGVYSDYYTALICGCKLTGVFVVYGIKKLEELIDYKNNQELDPIDTIIIPTDIGEDYLEMAEKYNIKCLVCKGIKNVPASWFNKKHEIDKVKTKIMILTEESLKEEEKSMKK